MSWRYFTLTSWPYPELIETLVQITYIFICIYFSRLSYFVAEKLEHYSSLVTLSIYSFYGHYFLFHIIDNIMIWLYGFDFQPTHKSMILWLHVFFLKKDKANTSPHFVNQISYFQISILIKVNWNWHLNSQIKKCKMVIFFPIQNGKY